MRYFVGGNFNSGKNARNRVICYGENPDGKLRGSVLLVCNTRLIFPVAVMAGSTGDALGFSLAVP